MNTRQRIERKTFPDICFQRCFMEIHFPWKREEHTIEIHSYPWLESQVCLNVVLSKSLFCAFTLLPPLETSLKLQMILTSLWLSLNLARAKMKSKSFLEKVNFAFDPKSSKLLKLLRSFSPQFFTTIPSLLSTSLHKLSTLPFTSHQQIFLRASFSWRDDEISQLHCNDVDML